MKPVIEQVITKDGDIIERFNPLANMILFAVKKAKDPAASDEAILIECGLSGNLHTIWKRKYAQRYLDWLEEMIDNLTHEKREVLEAVGMAQAIQSGNFQYWREMARTHGAIKEEVRASTININTDFSKVLNVHGNFADARRAILSELTGVEYTGRARVVDITHQDAGKREGSQGADKGEGAGIGGVQAEPLALSHPLGKNGGRPKRSGTVPAVSERPALASVSARLGKREKATSTKK